MQLARNFSFAGEPIEFELSCAHLVLIDPLALNGLSAGLQAVSDAPRSETAERFLDLSGALRIGLALVEDFRPGRYRLGMRILKRSPMRPIPRSSTSTVEQSALLT
jgi:hypothetical protein